MEESSIYLETVKSYFTENEWENLGEYGQIGVVVLYQKYKNKLDNGVVVEPPNYIKKFYEKKSVKKIRIGTHEVKVPIKKKSFSSNKAGSDLKPYVITIDGQKIKRNINNKDDISNVSNGKLAETPKSSHFKDLDLEDTVFEEAPDHDSYSDNEDTSEKTVAKTYNCDLCVHKFLSIRGLKYHISRSHKDNSSSKTNTLNSDITQKSADDNIDQNKEKNIKSSKNATNSKRIKSIKCEKCDFRTSKKCYLNDHIQSFHLKIKNFKCEQCDYGSYYKSGLNRHISTIHLDFRIYKCTECNYETNHKYDLTQHNKSVHLKLDEYKCKECAYFAPRKSHLNKHIINIHTERKYKCELCPKSFPVAKDLTRHIDIVHRQIKNFKCDRCQFVSSYLSVLNHHIDKVHLKIKKFKCNICGFATSYKSHLATHEATHGEMKYFCDQCNYCTYRKDSITGHIKSAHLNIKYYCDQCGKNFNRARDLTTHVNNIHSKTTRFQCEYCSHITAYSKNLKKHIEKKHLRIYKCDLCIFETNDKKDFTKHGNKVHLKYKKHKCKECGSRFAYKRERTIHFKSVHL